MNSYSIESDLVDKVSVASMLTMFTSQTPLLKWLINLSVNDTSTLKLIKVAIFTVYTMHLHRKSRKW